MGYQCSNPEVCTACHLPGHTAGNETCSFYVKQQDVDVFAGPWDHLSNFFACNIIYKENTLKSSEHAYQGEKAKKCGRPELAQEIYRAPTAFRAKQISKRIGCKKEWDHQEENVKIMEDVMRAKVASVDSVKEYLLSTHNKILAEGVPYDLFWGTGLTKEATANTTAAAWPGKNMMGKIMMKIRKELQEGEWRKPKGQKKKKRKLTSEEMERRSKARTSITKHNDKQPSMPQYLVQKKIQEIRKEAEARSSLSTDEYSDNEVFKSGSDGVGSAS